MNKSETFIISISKKQLKEIHTKHPKTKKRGGIQKYVYGLIDLALDEIGHEDYIPKAKEAAANGSDS